MVQYHTARCRQVIKAKTMEHHFVQLCKQTGVKSHDIRLLSFCWGNGLMMADISGMHFGFLRICQHQILGNAMHEGASEVAIA